MFEYESVNDMFKQPDEKEERKRKYMEQARIQTWRESRFDNMTPLQGYGSQSKQQHPFYRTSNKEYGWYVPGDHTLPNVYYPMKQKFSSQLAAAGMYRNHSLNTSMNPPPFIY